MTDHHPDHESNHHQETLSELATLRSTLADSTEVLIISKHSMALRNGLQRVSALYILIMSTCAEYYIENMA